MKPQTVRSRATRTLARMDSFSFAAPADLNRRPPLPSSDAGALVGRLTLEDGKYRMDVFENGIFLSKVDSFIPYRSMLGVELLEKSTETAKTIRVKLNERKADIVVETMTGRYKDIFDVSRFLLRCIEDSALRNAGSE